MQVSHVALVRSMIQIMALADGKPIVTGGPFALGFAVHSHMFYSQNAANYALMPCSRAGAPALPRPAIRSPIRTIRSP